MAKRFLLFAGDDYYPLGGGEDFIGSFETLEQAMESHDPNAFQYHGGWANVFDLETETVVKRFSRGTWYVHDWELDNE